MRFYLCCSGVKAVVTLMGTNMSRTSNVLASSLDKSAFRLKRSIIHHFLSKLCNEFYYLEYGTYSCLCC